MPPQTTIEPPPIKHKTQKVPKHKSLKRLPRPQQTDYALSKNTDKYTGVSIMSLINRNTQKSSNIYLLRLHYGSPKSIDFDPIAL